MARTATTYLYIFSSKISLSAEADILLNFPLGDREVGLVGFLFGATVTDLP